MGFGFSKQTIFTFCEILPFCDFFSLVIWYEGLYIMANYCQEQADIQWSTKCRSSKLQPKELSLPTAAPYVPFPSSVSSISDSVCIVLNHPWPKRRVGSYSGSQQARGDSWHGYTWSWRPGGRWHKCPCFWRSLGSGGRGLSRSYFSPAGSVWMPPQVHRNAPC